MNLTLEQLSLNEDKTKAIYASEDCQTLLTMWEEYYPKTGFHPPWIGYLVKDGDKVVGSCAFTGPPSDNRLEISYWTFAEFEGRGISTFACKQLVSIAKATDPAIVITAKTAPEKNASTSILARNGFVHTRIVQDHEIGDAWEWVLEVI